MNTEWEVAFNLQSTLAEGPVWCSRLQILSWVDITKKQIGFFDPTSGVNKILQLSHMVGAVAPTTAGDYLIAQQDGFYRINITTNEIIKISCPPDHDITQLRFNDGKCDPLGRFWAGTMALDFAKEAGSLYCLEPSGRLTTKLSQVTVSNGITWSHDKRLMYYIDSVTGTIDSFDFHNESGAIYNRKVVIRIDPYMGVPDGMTIDADGMLWIALWGGGSVICGNPVNGEILTKISLPATNVTSCTFGGKDLKSLYITTAREGLSAIQNLQQPLAGAVFVAQPGVAGVPTYYFNG